MDRRADDRTADPSPGQRRLQPLVAQEALKALTRLGLVETRTIGRGGVHTINDGHAVAPLRALVDPIAALKTAIDEVSDADVRAVILFGSIARGDPSVDSDIDLAAIAVPGV